ncbi:MAG: hypothetical protein ACYTFK_14225, partial [Planctomycetota bacterium]
MKRVDEAMKERETDPLVFTETMFKLPPKPAGAKPPAPLDKDVEEAKSLFESYVDFMGKVPEMGRRMVGMLISEADELAAGFGALGGTKALLSMTKLGGKVADIGKMEKIIQGMARAQRTQYRTWLKDTWDIRAARNALNFAGEVGVFQIPTVEKGRGPIGEELIETGAALGVFKGVGKALGAVKRGLKEIKATKAERPLEPERVEVEAIPEAKPEPEPKAPEKRPSFEEFEKMEPAEKQRIFEQNPVTQRPGTPHFERTFKEQTKGETVETPAGAGDVDGFKVVNDAKGSRAADDLNADIYDAGAKKLEDRLSNLHGDEYAVAAKAGETIGETVKRTQEAANEIAKIEIEIDGKIFNPTLKWKIETPKTLKEFGKINPKDLPPNTISYYDPTKKTYISVKAADVPPERIVTRDKFTKGPEGEIRLRRPEQPRAEAEQPTGEAPRPKDKGPGEARTALPKGKPKVPSEEAAVKEAEVPVSQEGFVQLPKIKWETAKDRIPPAAKEIHKEWVTNKQTQELESGKFINSLIKKRDDLGRKMTEAERELVPFLIEKSVPPEKLKRPDLTKMFKDQGARDNLKPIADEVQEHFHKGWEYMQKHLPDMSATEIENYVTHVWDIPKKKVPEAVNWFTTRNPLLKKRFIKTYAAGIEMGYKPKTLDIARLVNIHDQYMIKTTENVKLVEAFKKMQDESGVKLIQRSDKAPENWLMIDHPVLRRALYIPEGEAAPAKLLKVPVK